MKYRVIKTNFGQAKSYEVIGPEGNVVKEITEFLEPLRARNYSLMTLRSYAFDLVVFYEWLEHKKLKLGDLDKYKLHNFILFQTTKDLKPRTVNRRLQTATSFYRFHMNQELPSGSKYTTPAPFYKGQANPWVMGIH